MPKKPTEPKVTDAGIEAAIEQIRTKFGDEAIMKLGDRPKVNIDAIPTGSIGLDAALGIGGLPRGRIIEVFGPESSGKTTLTLHAIAEAQKKGGVCAFVDAEHAMDPEYAKRLGVKIEDLLISQPDTGEQALEIVESLVRSGKIDIIVVDSVAALTPRDEIEGDMGAHHVGKHARLMSQALRKLTAITAKSKTIVIFINQIRMKIGVMFGCLNYKSKVALADGSQEYIGKIVNQKMPVSVLSYNWKTDEMTPAKVTGWYRHENADHFLTITAYDPSGSGVAHVACTSNHPILTPTGWRRADNLKKGDRVIIAVTHRLNDLQREIIRGSLLGDGNLSPSRIQTSMGTRFRLGHGLKQKKYLEWKTSFFGNVSHTIYQDKKSIKFDLTPLPELYTMYTSMYRKGRKRLSAEFLSSLTPLSLAVWYQDDGHLDVRDVAKTKGRITICIEAIEEKSRTALQELLKERYDITTRLGTGGGKWYLFFDQNNSNKFMQLIRFGIHPSMKYKILPRYQRPLATAPAFSEPTRRAVSVPIIRIDKKSKTRSMRRFDLRVRGAHNFLADGVVVHNSPEDTTGGKALKFYTSVRLDIRRIAQIKKGDEVMGGRVRVKVVKNKVAAPFKSTEFDLMYNEGISREGELLALGEKYGIIKKSGASYSFTPESPPATPSSAKASEDKPEGTSGKMPEEVKLGRGYDAARQFLKEEKKVANTIQKEVERKLKTQ